MLTSLALFGSFTLFLLGLRLSAFFSGSETGFYRVSFPRLTIDAQGGDRIAKRLLWFSQNPSYFVATTLVGNNVANYLTTFAIGLAIASFYRRGAGWGEIIATLLVSPVVFIFGELVPKNLYYRAPLQLLRRDAPWFMFFYRAFLFLSFPLIWITKSLERLGRSPAGSPEIVLGRTRLMHVLRRGHEEGLLTDSQNRMVNGLLYTAAQPVRESVIPADRVLGITERVAREAFLEHARKYGLTSVVLRGTDVNRPWKGYIRVVDAAVDRRPLQDLIRPMPRIEAAGSKLEGLLLLREAEALYGVVYDAERCRGIVSQQGLVEQLFRSTQAPAARFGRSA